MSDKPQSLDELLNPEQHEKKKRPTIHDTFFSKMTPEEVKAFHKQAGQKRSEFWKREKEKKALLHEKAQALVPEILAHELMAEDAQRNNWVPKQETIDKIKALMSKNMTVEEMRRKYFRDISDNTWHRLMKYAFKSSIENVEDVGNEVFKAREVALKNLKKMEKLVDKQIKEAKLESGKKVIPPYLLAHKMDLIKRISELTNDFALTLHKVGAVGEKSKGPSLNVHLHTPRPKKEEAIKDVVEVDVGNIDQL